MRLSFIAGLVAGFLVQQARCQCISVPDPNTLLPCPSCIGVTYCLCDYRFTSAGLCASEYRMCGGRPQIHMGIYNYAFELQRCTYTATCSPRYGGAICDEINTCAIGSIQGEGYYDYPRQITGFCGFETKLTQPESSDEDRRQRAAAFVRRLSVPVEAYRFTERG